LLLLHSTVDINLSLFPSLMLLGFCLTSPGKADLKINMKFIMCAVLVPLLAVSVYLTIGESVYSKGTGYDRTGKLEKAEEAYRESLKWMPGDFRSTIRLAGIHILKHEQDKSIEILTSSENDNFNKTYRSEVLVTAYKNLGHYPEWDAETLALLKHAPLKQISYTERSEYLLAAYYSQLITENEYNNGFKELLDLMAAANKSITCLARFLPEENRSLNHEVLLRPW